MALMIIKLDTSVQFREAAGLSLLVAIEIYVGIEEKF